MTLTNPPICRERAGQDSNLRLLPPESTQSNPEATANTGFAGTSGNAVTAETAPTTGAVRAEFALTAGGQR